MWEAGLAWNHLLPLPAPQKDFSRDRCSAFLRKRYHRLLEDQRHNSEHNSKSVAEGLKQGGAGFGLK